tara:strand:+ start:898 stop:1386 length:489 start_codon:yes stop_codon:yes gene_type:complete
VNHQQIKTLVRSTLYDLGAKFAKKEAVDLVYQTGYVESRYEYIKQLGTGPARSFWQVEPGMTGALDNVKSYLVFRPKLAAKCADATCTPIDVWIQGDEATWDKILMVNLAAGIVHCRLKYWRSPLPLGNNVEENSRIWKSVYNTSAGKGTTKKYIDMVSSLT